GPDLAHVLGDVRADSPAGSTDHQPGEHHEPGVIVDAGEHLALPTVSQEHSAHNVHLPQLHGPAALPPLELAVPATPGPWVDEPGALERPVHPRARRGRIHAGPGGLMDQPPRT